MAHKPETYISVDVETSGPIPGEYSMLSLGACVIGNTKQQFYVELRPLNKNFVAKALKVSGLSLQKLQKQGELPAQAMARFEKWIKEVSGERRPVFVAFNATFDWSFTHWYFMKFLGRDPFSNQRTGYKSLLYGKTQDLME